MDTEIDGKTFWKAIGCRAIGVAVVTAKGTDGPAGFLAYGWHGSHREILVQRAMAGVGSFDLLTVAATEKVCAPCARPV